MPIPRWSRRRSRPGSGAGHTRWWSPRDSAFPDSDPGGRGRARSPERSEGAGLRPLAALWVTLPRRREEGFRGFLQLCLGQVLDVLCQPPLVAGGIFDASPAISPELICQWLHDLGAGIHRPLPERIDVVLVDVQVHRGAAYGPGAPPPRPFHLIAQHDHRITDLDDGVHDRPVRGSKPVGLLGSNRLLVELDCLRPIGDDETRGHAVVSLGNGLAFRCHCFSSAKGVPWQYYRLSGSGKGDVS